MILSAVIILNVSMEHYFLTSGGPRTFLGTASVLSPHWQNAFQTATSMGGDQETGNGE
jgi:hypothetical protein